ncbi:hypothetical protein PT276_00590 [Orbaceae bacterium ESL0721]|nr:hypothetical protein [Orbaceae bacterium ESL0721]
MFKTKISAIICLLLTPLSVMAQSNKKQIESNQLESIITAFTQCDDQFFKNITVNHSELSPYVDLIKSDQEIAYIAVEDVENDGKNSIKFKKPLKYRGLEFISYQNIYANIPSLGHFYYWGFIINNSRNEVKQALNEYKWQDYSDDITITNAQISDDSSPNWRPNPYTISDIAPKVGSMEKILYIEDVPDSNQVRLFCTLQGDVTKENLYKLRPDMKIIDKQLEKKHQELKLKREEKRAERQKRLKQQSIERKQSEKGAI